MNIHFKSIYVFFSFLPAPWYRRVGKKIGGKHSNNCAQSKPKGGAFTATAGIILEVYWPNVVISVKYLTCILRTTTNKFLPKGKFFIENTHMFSLQIGGSSCTLQAFLDVFPQLSPTQICETLSFSKKNSWVFLKTP